jgi:hypothetical protein
MRRLVFEYVKPTKKKLVESMLHLLEARLIINKLAPLKAVQKIIFTFARGYYPNAILSGGDGVPYNILILKSNKGELRYSNSSSDIGKDAQTTMDNYAATAKAASVLGKYYSKLPAPEFLKLMTNDLGVHHLFVTKYFPELATVEQDNKVAAGSFEVTYLSDKDAKTISDFAVATEAILRKQGFDKLCYGKLISTASLGSRAIADYADGTDTIRISNKAKKGDEAIRVLIHELGHRLWHKFMSTAQQKEVYDKYKEVYDGTEVAIGDVVTISTKQGKIDVTVDSSLNWGKDYKLKEINPPKDTPAGYYSVSAKSLKTLAKKGDPKAQWKVTAYAGTVATEFFPEVLSFALTDPKKNKELYDWIQQFKP